MKVKIFADVYNLVWGMVVSVLTAIFGVYWYVFAAYMAMQIFDWITGCFKARKKKESSSAVGVRGILKKLGYWIIIAIAFLMSAVFIDIGRDLLHVDLSFLAMIGWFTLACLLVNEIRSVLENMVELGYMVPDILVRGLAITEKMTQHAAENILPDDNGEEE